MFRDEKLELKVGVFMGASIFLLFLIVFSISDVHVLEKGYDISVTFDYVNGITKNSPVRLAGVDVGDVNAIEIFYDEDLQRTRVRVNVWITDDVRISTDSVPRINTLGLLGEQYLEITPGVEKEYMADGGEINGKNPVNMGQQMEKMSELVASFNTVMQKVAKGEGTVGKLITEDTIYNDLEDFVADIKAHPWKLFKKDTGGSSRTKKRGTEI